MVNNTIVLDKNHIKNGVICGQMTIVVLLDLQYIDKDLTFVRNMGSWKDLIVELIFIGIDYVFSFGINYFLKLFV